MLPIFRFKSETFTLSETVARSHLRPFFSPAEASRRSTSSVLLGVCVGWRREGLTFSPPRHVASAPGIACQNTQKTPEPLSARSNCCPYLPFFSLPPSLVPSRNPLPYILCRSRKTTRSGKSILNEKMFRWGPPCGSVCPGEFVLCFWFIYHFCCVLAIFFFFLPARVNSMILQPKKCVTQSSLPPPPSLLCASTPRRTGTFSWGPVQTADLFCCSSVSSRLLDTVLPQIWKKKKQTPQRLSMLTVRTNHYLRAATFFCPPFSDHI